MAPLTSSRPLLLRRPRRRPNLLQRVCLQLCVRSGRLAPPTPREVSYASAKAIAGDAGRATRLVRRARGKFLRRVFVATQQCWHTPADEQRSDHAEGQERHAAATGLQRVTALSAA